MQRTALGFNGLLWRWIAGRLGIGAIALLLFTSPAFAQFRDVTPGAAGEAEELSPEPLSEAEANMAEEAQADGPLEPHAVPPAPVIDESMEDEPTAEYEQEIQEEINKALIDDTSIRPLPFRGIKAGVNAEIDFVDRLGEPFREN
jgi:hypothetical protein